MAKSMTDLIERDHAEGLQVVGDKEVSLHGWNMATVMVHLRRHLSRPLHWCSVRCLARTFYRRDSQENRRKVRSHMHNLFRTLLTQDTFLVMQYTGEHGAIELCKILNPKAITEAEAQAVNFQLNRMRKRRELNEDQEQHARTITGVA